MTDENLIERIILELVEDVQQEIREHESAVAQLREKLRSYTTTLSDIRAKLGAVSTATTAENSLIESLRGLTVRDMLLRWADAHGGVVVMKDIVRAAVAGGLFRDRTQANGSFYPQIGRMSDEFERSDKGVYSRRQGVVVDTEYPQRYMASLMATSDVPPTQVPREMHSLLSTRLGLSLKPRLAAPERDSDTAYSAG